ncbi:MAG TPA: secondary thiamine-phosphate synthase enzyme YjbQ [Candidatus Thermoplasmatota archaeon]|nr:secondary thiamine-phosphate synthase enzyme YjbQ [Candidatus Thermoplasmatota archaeon]
MRQHAADIRLSTGGEIEVRDLTADVAKAVAASGVRTGQALVFTMSSTSAITVTEFEPGLAEEDIPQALERLFPKGLDYGHERRWRDGNGHSHVRAAFLKPDLTVPVREGKLHLGTWQQIVFVELDNKPRQRTVAVHVWGE